MYHHAAALLGRTFGSGRSRVGALLVAPAPVDQKRENAQTNTLGRVIIAHLLEIHTP